VKIFCAFLEG